MKTLIPGIVLIAAGLIFAGSIEPEYRTWDRATLEAAYVEKLEEVAQLRRELAVARKQLAELQPPEVATDGQADPAERPAPAKQTITSLKQLIREMPRDVLLRGETTNKLAGEPIAAWINEHFEAVDLEAPFSGASRRTRGDYGPGLYGDSEAVRVTRINGVYYTVWLHGRIPDAQAEQFIRGRRGEDVPFAGRLAKVEAKPSGAECLITLFISPHAAQ